MGQQLSNARVPQVLLVDDKPEDVAVVRGFLNQDAVVTHSPTLKHATRLVRRQSFDVALADASLPDGPNARAIDVLTHASSLPIILLTDVDSPELCERATRSGAQDYLIKGQLQRTQLVRSIFSAIYRHEVLIQYKTLLTSCPDGVVIVNAQGIVLFANEAAINTFQLDLTGTNIGLPISGKNITEISLRNGRTAEMRVAEIPWHGSAAYLMMLRDVSDRVRAAADLARVTQKLETLAVVDPLTEVLNRRGVERDLQQLLNMVSKQGCRATSILIDCDDFKSINQTSGYSAGDATLKLVAQAINKSVRPTSDTVGRIGGDEFIVLLPDAGVNEASLVAERIRAAVHSRPLPLSAAHGRREVTVSMGVAAIPQGAASLNEVIASAQAALMASKDSGKDRVTLEGGVTHQHSNGIHDLIQGCSTINAAAHRVVRIADQSLAGYELLARGPQHGPFASPDAMFSAARRENITTAFDLLCLRRCVEASQLLTDAPWVSINILPTTILDTPLEKLEEILHEATRKLLVLELNEQEYVGDPRMLLPRLHALRNSGVLFALDDIGFGRSSFETLMSVEPDIVKIDRGAVTGVAENREQRRVLERMLRCLAPLAPHIIAEGVESKEDAQVILDIGIPLAQGFLWGRPEIIACDTIHHQSPT